MTRRLWWKDSWQLLPLVVALPCIAIAIMGIVSADPDMRMADVILVLDGARLVESGSHRYSIQATAYH